MTHPNTPKTLFKSLILLLLLCYPDLIRAISPPDPISCNQTDCVLRNSYGVWPDRKACRVSAVAYPSTEVELRRAVAEAVREKLKIKVVSRFSHTIPKWACPDPKGVLISTEKYGSGVVVDAGSLSVTAEAGVGLRDLIDRVEAEGLSLGAAPYWEGVSVGGAVSTGAHGSSWWGRGGAVHDHVVGMRLIVAADEAEGFAKVVELREGDEMLKAAKVSLGLLGVISKVTLSLEEGFKRSITYNFTSDAGIEAEFMDHAKKYEFGDIQWYPSKRTAVYRYDVTLPSDTSGDGVNDFIGFQPNFDIVVKTLRASEKAAEKARNVKAKCLLASTSISYKKLTANGLKNSNQIFTSYPVIGRQGKMQTSGSCLYSSAEDRACAWDPRINGLSFFESTAIFPAGKFADFFRDVKRLRDLNPENFCGVDMYNGFLIRFIPRSEAYLGQAEDSVVVDFNYFRADEGMSPRLNMDVMEEIEQIAFVKYGARPHWGKNRDWAFVGVGRKYGRGFERFLGVKRGLDPGNVFSGEWSDGVFGGGGGGGGGDGCALEGMCVCSEDRHCSPANGYLCRRGLVYVDARVCRYSSSTSSVS